ncbi:MAG TPA: dihydropteroate synthase [Dongiaceae bacterium]|jgi:dihydropteroate synthase|nr:dihydropteroate synthase [Dongiaceae bacterium]
MTRYLIPRGIISGPAAARAVEAGLALPLAGGPLAFTLAEAIERGAGEEGHRRAVNLTSARAFAPELVDALAGPRAHWAGFDLQRPLIMGVVNVTPDSFSDGGDFAEASAAIDRGRAMLAAGADIVDVGGESTRPGAKPVPPEEEAKRVLPVVRALAHAGAVVSIDTRHAAVMDQAVQAGAWIINDVTALTGDAESPGIAAKSGAAIVLMHMLGDPQTMQLDPRYADVTCDLLDYFEVRLAALEKSGVDRARIAVDPGIGFGKKDPHNLRLLDELAAFHAFGCPVLLGASRKGFIGRLSKDETPKQRTAGTLAAHQMGFDRGAQIVRVHDAAEAFQARAIWVAGLTKH